MIHAAAQPSHDLAASRPFDDFDVNAIGTLNLLEAARRHTPRRRVHHRVAPTRSTATTPTGSPLVELDTRWDYADPRDGRGHRRDDVARPLHPLAVRRVQGGRRRAHPGVRPLLRAAHRHLPRRLPHRPAPLPASSCTASSATSCSPRCARAPYTIFGYKGKQVRDQIHSADVISAFWAFAQDPRPGEAYNLGGGKANAASLLECVELVADGVGRQAPRAHLRRAGPGRRPHLLLLRHGQVPGALPRLAPGARPRRPSSRRWWPPVAAQLG